MQRLIFGASGLGREILAFIHESQEVLAFVDDRRTGQTIEGVRVISQDSIGAISDEVSGVIAVGNPRIRESIGEAVKDAGIHFTPILLGYMGSRVSVGVGVVVCPGAILTTDIVVGKHTYINVGCMIGHDVRIGKYCMLNPSSNASGNVKIGHCTYVGAGAIILQGLTLGHHVVVGAGAVVTKDVPDNTTVMGVPARPMRKRAEEPKL